MIDVEQVVIDVQVPQDELRIVAMQPYIRFRGPVVEPFRWSTDAVEAQLGAISRTLDISLTGFNGLPANFTVFPEYAIPGVPGASLVSERIAAGDWPNGSIIIGGLDGITKAEYVDLCRSLDIRFSALNAPDTVPDGQWVNCCLLWVKNQKGMVDKWVQPKVRPAWTELAVPCNDMFRGSTVYVFECQYGASRYPCRFVTLICFDWVASPAGTTVIEELVMGLDQKWVQSQGALDWVFVIQHNSRPNSASFLNATYRFLTDPSHPFVQRDKAVVLHVNTAVSPNPVGKGEGAFSACVFSPTTQFDCRACRPTVCMQPSVRRANNALERCKDVVFREMGECVHAFSARVPRFVVPDATDRSYPLPLAEVHAVKGSGDPRLCGGSVPAAVKWLNDALDEINKLAETQLVGRPLRAKAEALESTVIAKVRTTDGHTASAHINWATCAYRNGSVCRDKARMLNVDLWGLDEVEALDHILDSLTSLGLAYGLEFDGAVLHCTLRADEKFVQVLAIRGDAYGDCRLHYDEYVAYGGVDPVLVIARGRHPFVPGPREFLRLDETGDERGLAFLSYAELINICREVTDSNHLKECLDAILPRDRRII